jgi:preprotein translocase subunit SecB
MAKKKTGKKKSVRAGAKQSSEMTEARVDQSFTEDTLFQHLKLLHVRLTNLQANLEIRGGKNPSKAKIESGANVGISTNEKNLHINSVIDILGRPGWEEHDDDGSRLQIHLEYQVVFQILNIPPREFLKFPNPLITAGMLMVWPHFRETVLSLTAKMGMPPFVLPTFVSGPAGVMLGGAEMKIIESEGLPGLLSKHRSASQN